MTDGVRVPPIDLVLVTGAEPELVWRTLTEPDRVALWFTDAPRLGGVGDPYRLDFGDGTVVAGEILAVEPGHALSYSWAWDGAEPGEVTRVTWTVEPHLGGSRVRPRPRGLGRGRPRRRGARRPRALLVGLPGRSARRPRGGVTAGGRRGGSLDPRVRPLQSRRPADPAHDAAVRRGDEPVLDRLQPVPRVARVRDGDDRARLDDRVDRRRARRLPGVVAPRTGSGAGTIFAAGAAASLVAIAGLIASEALPLIIVSAALWAAANQAVQVVVAPYMTEHSEPDHRNELFAIQFALQNVTNIIAAVLGGVVAGLIAAAVGLDPAGPGTYRVILVIMFVLVGGGARVGRAADRRPAAHDDRPQAPAAGRAGGLPRRSAAASRVLLGITIRDRGRFAKLVIPGLLISIGAGQIIPFLNLYVQREVRAEPHGAQRRVRAHVARHGGGDPPPAAAGAAVRPDHVGRHRPGRVDPVPRRARVLAGAVDGDRGDGRPELADERRQPDLQRVRHGAGDAGRASDAVGGDERAVADRLGHRRGVVRAAPG